MLALQKTPTTAAPPSPPERPPTALERADAAIAAAVAEEEAAQRVVRASQQEHRTIVTRAHELEKRLPAAATLDEIQTLQAALETARGQAEALHVLIANQQRIANQLNAKTLAARASGQQVTDRIRHVGYSVTEQEAALSRCDRLIAEAEQELSSRQRRRRAVEDRLVELRAEIVALRGADA